MPRRNAASQPVHDAVIARLQQEVAAHGYTAWGNPGGQKNSRVAERWPDVVAVEKHEEEVETAESVTESVAFTQWLPYARLGVPLTVVVPESTLRAAEQLLVKYDIAANVVRFFFRETSPPGG